MSRNEKRRRSCGVFLTMPEGSLDVEGLAKEQEETEPVGSGSHSATLRYIGRRKEYRSPSPSATTGKRRRKGKEVTEDVIL